MIPVTIMIFPKASADACLVSAYALLACQQALARHVWLGSVLSELQRSWLPKYDLKDFHFWVMYGSWTHCRACGSSNFNAAYFSQSVYQSQRTSGTASFIKYFY